jgi:hypothetical protein
MELFLERKHKKSNYTIGNLYIDDRFFCNTLEDKDRGLTCNMVETQIKSLKVYGETAIPTGSYTINMNTVSPKFKSRSWAKPYGGKLPRLLNVKGFEGVLIHVGNTIKDTLGCIIVGENKVKGQVINSKETFKQLYKLLQDGKSRGEKIIIKIE